MTASVCPFAIIAAPVERVWELLDILPKGYNVIVNESHPRFSLI